MFADFCVVLFSLSFCVCILTKMLTWIVSHVVPQSALVTAPDLDLIDSASLPGLPTTAHPFAALDQEPVSLLPTSGDLCARHHQALWFC